MTVIEDLRPFSDFNVEQAIASLWIFKKRSVIGDTNPFTAVSVLMSDTLRDQLKELINNYRNSHTFSENYDLLAQCTEGGFLSAPMSETLFPSLKELIDLPPEEQLVRNVKQLNNAAGYILRLRHEDQLLYCIKKTPADWATRKKKDVMSVVFKQTKLDVVDDPSFSFTKFFDFFVIGNQVLMTNKAAFESLLNHKTSYMEDYAELKQESEFSAVIADFSSMDTYVGTNATQLRRMTVIRVRGYYKNPDYLNRLKNVNQIRSWGIQFDERGKIVPTAETMRAIMQALLDHRLRSELSENEYDVPSTSLIG